MSYTAPSATLEVVAEANRRLGKIEAEEGVTVFFAIESGSRAWGFPSPDSDYDVRYFYTRPLRDYMGLESPKDVINREIDGLWDINGWDIGKAIRLLANGNASAAEWLSSPIIYIQHGSIPFKLRDLIKRHANPDQSARHYYGLGKTCYQSEIARAPTLSAVLDANARGEFIKGITTINQKKYLYALRASICLSWIERYNEIPPMTMPSLMSHDIIPDAVRSEIDDLLRRKANMGEFLEGPRIPTLDEFIEGRLAWAKGSGFDKLVPNKAFQAEANELLLGAYGL